MLTIDDENGFWLIQVSLVRSAVRVDRNYEWLVPLGRIDVPRLIGYYGILRSVRDIISRDVSGRKYLLINNASSWALFTLGSAL